MGIDLIDEIREKYDGIILAVAHKKFSKIDIKSLKMVQKVLYLI